MLRKLSDADNQRVVADYLSGASAVALEQHYPVKSATRATVQEWSSDEELDAAVERIQDGFS